MNNALQQKLLEIIDQLQHHSPVAMSLVLQSIRMDAINDLLNSMWSVPFFLTAVWVFRRFTSPELRMRREYYKAGPEARYRMENGELGVVIISLIGVFLLTFIGMGIVSSDVSFWTFVAIQHPEVWLAHLAVSKVL